MLTPTTCQKDPNTNLWLIIKPPQLEATGAFIFSLKSPYSFQTWFTAFLTSSLSVANSSTSCSFGWYSKICCTFLYVSLVFVSSSMDLSASCSAIPCSSSNCVVLHLYRVCVLLMHYCNYFISSSLIMCASGGLPLNDPPSTFNCAFASLSYSFSL